MIDLTLADLEHASYMPYGSLSTFDFTKSLMSVLFGIIATLASISGIAMCDAAGRGTYVMLVHKP